MSATRPWVSLVATSGGPCPRAGGVAARLAELYPDAPPLRVTSETEASATFTWGQATGNITLVPRAIPWTRLEGPCATAWYWPGAEGAMRGHAAHLLVTLLDESRAPTQKAIHLTQLTAAVAGSCDAVGVVWGPSSLVHSPEGFASVASHMAPDDLPLHLWVDFRVYQEEDAAAFGLFTTGLEALDRREMEVRHYTGDPHHLAGAVYNIAHYVLLKGPVLKDGEVVGLPDDRQVTVRFSRSMVDPEQEVIRLTFE